ncbi:MAG: lytic transglycosylase domain-containing protein [Clostridia bacterium]
MNLRKKTRTKWFVVIMVIVIIILAFGVFKIQNVVLEKIYPKKYAEYVYRYSEENEIDPLLTFAIIKAESNFNKNVVSSSGAIGLMQLMESTATETAENLGEALSVKEALFHPETNIKIGTSYFAHLKERYHGNELLALTAYNAGIGNVDEWIQKGTIKEDGSDIENIPYKETNNYVRKIVRDYKIYQDLYKE